MPELPKLILAATPEQARQLRQPDYTIAHMAYRTEPGPRLMRLRQAQPGPGGLLYLSCEQLSGSNYNFFTQQILRECRNRHFQGVIADIQPGFDSLVAQMDGLLSQNALTLYVPEAYHALAPKARLLISTALTGGALRQRLEDSAKRYGANRMIPALEKVAVEVIPPDKAGQGRPLSAEELQHLRTIHNPRVFWSPELAMRYFTYTQDRQVRFVLFDDEETMQAKLRLCNELGIRACLAAWGDMRP